MIYAQIDADNICFAVSDLVEEVVADDLIPIEEMDLGYIGKKYVDGEFVEMEQEVEAFSTLMDMPIRDGVSEKLDLLMEAVVDLQKKIADQ